MITEARTLTMPAAPRPARISLVDGSTSEFLGAADLYSVLISYSTTKGFSGGTSSAEKESSDSSKHEIGITARIESTRPRIVQLAQKRREHYAMLKKYDGVVVSRDNDSFTARLYENASDYPVMEAEFDLTDVPESEWRFVVEGAPLVWTISYRHQGSTRSRDSMIYLRRSAWSAQEVAAAKERVSKLVNAIDWDESSTD